MDKLTIYATYDELKHRPATAETNSDQSTERHLQFAASMQTLRQAYLESQSKTAAEFFNKPVNSNEL